MYRVRATGEVKSQGEIRRDNPNTSLPANWDAETCDVLGIDPVLNGAQPTPTEYQYVVQDGVEEINGQWFTKFICVDLSEEAIEAKNNEKKASNKARAEQLLKDTDWTQVPDVPLVNKQAFTDYRAVIRAIALNPTVEAVFPELPQEQWS